MLSSAKVDSLSMAGHTRDRLPCSLSCKDSGMKRPDNSDTYQSVHTTVACYGRSTAPGTRSGMYRTR